MNVVNMLGCFPVVHYYKSEVPAYANFHARLKINYQHLSISCNSSGTSSGSHCKDVGIFQMVFWATFFFSNTFHSGFVNWFAKFPNVPYRYVFRQLSSEVSHLHRAPLKSRQSAKIRTTVVWGSWERKSRSSACRRSNVGLPICLHPFLMQFTVLQIFIKILNMSFFPITLHSLRFMTHAKTKPNNGLRGVAFSWASFDLWPTNHINFARFHVQKINKLNI